MFFFFFNDTATTEIYTLSLHDALPIYLTGDRGRGYTLHLANRLFAQASYPFDASFLGLVADAYGAPPQEVDYADSEAARRDRKSTRLNSSHANISYAVFCLKKTKIKSE